MTRPVAGKHLLYINFPASHTRYLAHFYPGGKVRVVSQSWGENFVFDELSYCLSLIRVIFLGV